MRILTLSRNSSGTYAATLEDRDGNKSMVGEAVCGDDLPILMATFEAMCKLDYTRLMLDESIRNSGNGAKRIELPTSGNIGFRIIPTSEWGTCVVGFQQDGQPRMVAGSLRQILYSLSFIETTELHQPTEIHPRDFCKFLDQRPKE